MVMVQLKENSQHSYFNVYIFLYLGEGTYKLNGKEIDELIESCDINGDGKIDLAEFLGAMKK